jgi:hypothetical protein
LQNSYPEGTVARVDIQNPISSLLKLRDLSVDDGTADVSMSQMLFTGFGIHLFALVVFMGIL